jgi:hypothetical protein
MKEGGGGRYSYEKNGEDAFSLPEINDYSIIIIPLLKPGFRVSTLLLIHRRK